MSELTTQLPERLNNTEETGLDAVLLIPLLRLIVEGGLGGWATRRSGHG
ncbi:hypothetical protein [Microcella alkalica]|nr:hypothetical protein [Microcella alkalica]